MGKRVAQALHRRYCVSGSTGEGNRDHTQRISAAATRSNAKNMRAQLHCLKQRAYRLA